MKNYLNASSPDELALVNAGKYFGYDFIGRSDSNSVLIKHLPTGDILKFELLNVIEFTSARKRMTIIVRD